MSGEQNNAVNPQRIIDMASAFYPSCVLFSASDLGVFDRLHARRQATADELARDNGLEGRATRLLLDACVAVGLLNKDGDRYRNTPEAEAFLVNGAPRSLSKAIRYNRDVYPAWGRLPQLVRTGLPVEAPDIHLGSDPERTRAFVLSMHGRAMGMGRAVVPQLDLAGRRRVLDLAGGPGTYSVLMAQAHPSLQCTVVDLPEVIAVARELIEAAGMSDRVTCLAGNYHTLVIPPGYDVINLFGALHQESEADIRGILCRVFDALEPGGCLHILDMMTDASHTQPVFSALFAVNMALTSANGWVFSDAELRGWLEEAGFVDCSCRPLPPPMPHWLMRARRP